MRQIRITRQRRTAGTRRRDQQELSLDPRDPDVLAAKRLARRMRTRLDLDDLAPDAA
jgi:hypothetical protein